MRASFIMPNGNGDRMLKAINLLSAVIAIGWLGLSSAFTADGWKYQVVPNDGHVLTYSEADKVTFYLGCGRGFALALKYPGIAKKEGRARVTISNAKSKMHFHGEFVEPSEVQAPGPRTF